MNPQDLEDMCDKQESFGLKHMTLTMPRKSPPSGERCRTPFGLAEIAQWYDGRLVFWIEISKVRAFLKRVKTEVK